MIAFYFGDRQRRLFGVYDPAEGNSIAKRGVVICHPWGNEHIFAYRTLRHLARQLSQEGVHVLRFDYYGTGDSRGATGEGDCESWCRDVETAMDELRDVTGLTKVGLIGLRLGATLATRVAAQHAHQIDALLLWDPVSGETTATIGATTKSSAKVIGGTSTGTKSEDIFAQINVSPTYSALPERALVLLTSNTPPHNEFGELEVERVIAEPAWSEERVITGTIPINAVQRIVQWIK
jgi:uncharacterized protein